MIRYLCPHARAEIHSGGLEKLYDHVDILRAAGLQAEAIDVSRQAPAAEPGDLLVFPEIYGDLVRTAGPGIARVSLNQNAHNSWANVADAGRHPYVNNPDLLAVVCMSAHNAEMLSYAFPGVRVERITTSVGRVEDFRCGPFPRRREVCYFARKRGDRARMVLGLLLARNALHGWTVTAMDGMSDADVAATMRRAAIFLSLSELEGFGSPPLEALACGSRVVGFTGHAGTEVFDRFGISVAEDDVLGYARALEQLLDTYTDAEAEAVGRAGSRWALETYSRDAEVATVVTLFDELDALARARGGRDGAGTDTPLAA